MRRIKNLANGSLDHLVFSISFYGLFLFIDYAGNFGGVRDHFRKFCPLRVRFPKSTQSRKPQNHDFQAEYSQKPLKIIAKQDVSGHTPSQNELILIKT